MFMFLMFALIDLVVIGIFYAVYGMKRKYSEGMLLGVHLPQSAAESEEVTAFMARYHRNTKIFYAVNVVISTAICGFCFWYISVFMVVWSVWLLEFCIGAMVLLYGNHRKLYDMKVEKGWIGSSGSRIMAVDTKAAVQSGRMGLSPWWHLLFCLLILMPCIDADIRHYLMTSDDGWIFLVTGILVSLTFGILHIAILRMRNKVYSEDSGLNVEVNRMQKNVWSWALAGSSLFNAAAYLLVVSGIDGNGWISTGVLVIYCIMETIPGVFLIGGFFYMRSRKEKLLQKNERPLYIDDDVYWKNGWYSNPNDKRLMVQDWACSWNYTTNMAKPAGKIFMFLAIVFVAVFLVWGCVEMWKIDFVPIELNTSDTQVEITSGYSDYDIAYDDITGVELLDSLPDDDYRRINGGADQHKMMGRFKGENTGRCRMYLYVGYTPVLEIMTEDGPVYVNSKDGQETEEWMREIMQQVQPAPSDD